MSTPIRTVFVTLGLLLASCQAPVEPAPRGVLAISFQTARTVVASLEVDHYEVILTKGAGAARSGSGQQTVTIDSLEDGTWALAAVALSVTGSVVASGSTAVVLSGQGANVVVPMATTQDGYGTFSFAFTVPVTAGVAAVQARLLHQGTSQGEVTLQGLSLPIDPEDPTRLKATLTNNDFENPVLASGDYLLLLSFLGGSDQVLGHHAEAINVWDNVESNAWLDPQGNLHPQRDFAGGEFASTSAVPGNIVVKGPGDLISFTPSLFEYNFDTNGTLSVTAEEGEPGQDLQFRVEGGAWNPLRWGEALNVSFHTSTRIDLRVTAPDRSTFLDYALIDPYHVIKVPKDPDYIPGGLTMGGNGNLYVLDPNAGRILVVEPNGDSSVYVASTSLNDAFELAEDSQGNLYVTIPDSKQIWKVDSSGNVALLADFSADPIGGYTVNPAGIAVTPSGNMIYITDRANGRVIEHNPFSGGSAVLLSGLNTPGSVALSLDGRFLYVAGGADGEVHRVAIDDAFHTVLWSQPGSYPAGLTIDDQGNVYVCLLGAHTVIKIQPGSPAIVTTIVGDGTPGFLDGYGTSAKLNSPKHLCWSPEGVFYFSESGEPRLRTIQ